MFLDGELLNPKQVREWKRKSEKYDKQMHEDFHEYKKRGYADGAILNLEEREALESKLEAIRTWGEKYFSTFRQFAPIAELEKILESEGRGG